MLHNHFLFYHRIAHAAHFRSKRKKTFLSCLVGIIFLLAATPDMYAYDGSSWSSTNAFYSVSYDQLNRRIVIMIPFFDDFANGRDEWLSNANLYVNGVLVAQMGSEFNGNGGNPKNTHISIKTFATSAGRMSVHATAKGSNSPGESTTFSEYTLTTSSEKFWFPKRVYETSTNRHYAEFYYYFSPNDDLQNVPMLLRDMETKEENNGNTYKPGSVEKKLDVSLGLSRPRIHSHTFQGDGSIKFSCSVPGFAQRDRGYGPGGKTYISSMYRLNKVVIPYEVIVTNDQRVDVTIPKRALADYNNAEGIDVNLTRKDYDLAKLIDVTRTVRNNISYTLPPYPQPTNLNAEIKDTKITFKWDIKPGFPYEDCLSPTDGYHIEWQRNGGAWSSFGTSIEGNLNYNVYETAHTITYNLPETGQGTQTYNFRLKRANLNWGVFDATKNGITVNTNKQTLTGVSAQLQINKVVVNWSVDNGWVSSNWLYRIYKKTGSGTFEKVTEQTFDSGKPNEWTDNSIELCTKYTYEVRIFDGTSEYVSRPITQAIVRPLENPGQVTNLSVSKGYYNDRVAISWAVSANAAFKYFVLSRLMNDDPNAIEQNITDINHTGLTNYRYEDNTAIPGIYYTYKITAYAACVDDISSAGSLHSTGFIQPYGIASGRIAYGTGTAVEGASVIATGESSKNNRSLRCESTLYTSVETPYRENSLSPVAFTFQAWIKDDQYQTINNSTGTDHAYFASKYRYKVDHQKTTGNGGGNLRLTVYNSSGTPSSFSFAPSEWGPDEADDFYNPETLWSYRHITITYSVNTAEKIATAKLYINGKLKDTRTKAETDILFTQGVGFKTPDASKDTKYSFLGKGVELGEYFTGNLDELRLWKKTLTDDEVAENYDRYLSGKEENLAAYYRFDETSGSEIFDISGRNGVLNENHGTVVGGNGSQVRSTSIPAPEQLSIKSVTDRNGAYIINTIPYTGDGSLVTLTPMMGVHQFNPDGKPLFFSHNSNTHNNIDFTDISSFRVSGTVYYEGGTYPVQGCSFKVDGRTVIDDSGNIITSDASGKYIIDIPIGTHSLQVEKTGHTFVDNGFAYNNAKNINFQDNIINLNFRDLTRVKLIGHVVGGKGQAGKASGFGIRNNNIGSDVLKLVASKEQYELSSAVKDTTFLHNNGEWTDISALRQDSTKVRFEGNNVTIHVSPVTGEYVAWLYPEQYTIENITVSGALGTIYDKRETLDLTNTPLPNNSLLSTSTRNWVDSVFVPQKGSQAAYWQHITHSDTIRFHKEWGYFHQAQPTFTVKQLNGSSEINYYGEEKLVDEANEIDVNFFSEGAYTFGKPVFLQNKSYRFALKAFEEYTNTKTNVSETLPVIDGAVQFTNNFTYDEKTSSQVYLDSLGRGTYEWLGGDPDLTTGVKALSVVVTIDGYSYYSDNFGAAGLDGYLLGGRSTGTDFMTAAPDKVEFVLHDPPGTSSSAYMEAGTTVVVREKKEYADGVAQTVKAMAQIGTEVITMVGGLGVMMGGTTSSQSKVGVDEEYEHKVVDNKTTETSTTYFNRVETSGSPDFVGHSGDVFVGKGVNTLFGLRNSVTVNKTAAFGGVGILATSSTPYSLGKATGFALGQSFDTQFYYTERELEEIMIPKWEDAIKSVFVFDKTGLTPATVTAPVYYSKLQADDPNFGKLNSDSKAFGSSATSTTNGPSYEVIIPQALLNKMRAGLTTTGAPQGTVVFTDTIVALHSKIDQWKKLLADNEKAKVEAKYDKNYSFGGGAVIEINNSAESITTTEKGTTDTYHLFAAGETEISVFGVGVETEATLGAVGDRSNITENESSKTATFGFTLAEEGVTDEITVDVGTDLTSGSYVFKTRGGRTSCPYEGERKTKYYKPGVYVLSEATMQVEKPVLTVKGGNYRVQVPSTRPATYTLELKNESEVNATGWFILTVDESTNPYGAVIKIDGGVIGNGRFL
jgi:hypothetical protein